MCVCVTVLRRMVVDYLVRVNGMNASVVTVVLNHKDEYFSRTMGDGSPDRCGGRRVFTVLGYNDEPKRRVFQQKQRFGNLIGEVEGLSSRFFDKMMNRKDAFSSSTNGLVT